MRFFQTVIGAAALVSSVVAQTAPTLGFTKAPSSVTAGQTYTLEYAAPAGAPVTISLREGDAKDLKTISDLTTTSTGGSFQWTVSKDLKDGDDYALEIKQGDAVNYYGPFALSGGSASGSSSSASASASSSASASATYASESLSITASASLSSAISSFSSLVSAANSSLASLTSLNATFTSSNATATPISNLTSTLRTSTATSTVGSSGTGAGGSRTASSTAGAPTSAAAMPNMASPVALILGAVAAIVFLN